MGDFSNIAGNYYRKTEDMMEPRKEEEKDNLFSAASAIKKMKEQGGSDEEMRAQGPYPSTAASGLGTPDAPPADIGQQGLSTKGADDAAASGDDFSRTPATKPGANELATKSGANEQAEAFEKKEKEVTERNARNNT